MGRSSVICKQLVERRFLKYVDAKNLQCPAESFIDSMNLIETGHYEVNADGDRLEHSAYNLAKRGHRIRGEQAAQTGETQPLLIDSQASRPLSLSDVPG